MQTPAKKTSKLQTGKRLIAIACLTASLLSSVTAFAEEENANTSADAAAPAVTEAAPAAEKPIFYVAKTSGRENIASWKTVNNDVKAWLKVPGTNINHAVVQGKDNLTYMQLGYDKQYSYNGVIWADSDSTFGTRDQLAKNNVVYGHNWTNYAMPLRITNANDVMFGQLPSYHYLTFAQQHPYIYYSTPEEDMVWQVFSVFYTEDSFDYITSNPSTQKMSNLIKEVKQRSLHNFNVEVTANDKILTLSTCTRVYGKRADQRFVVMAKLLPKNAKLTAVTVTENKNFKAPQLPPLQ